MQPIPHAAHDIRDQRKGRWVVIWPREVMNAIVDLGIRIPGALGAKLPDTPVLAMLEVEELDQLIERIAVCSLGICCGRTGRCDDWEG